MEKRGSAVVAMRQLQTNFPQSGVTRKAQYFFPVSPNKSKLAIFERKPERAPPSNFLSMRRIMPPANPETCVLMDQNMKMLRPIEIIFPKDSRRSASNDKKFPQRSHMKTAAQIMMQVKQLRKEAWKEVAPELSFTEKIEVREPVCEYRVPPRKIRSELHNRQTRSKSLYRESHSRQVSRQAFRRDSLPHGAQRPQDSHREAIRPYEDIRLEGWSTVGNHSCYITRHE